MIWQLWSCDLTEFNMVQKFKEIIGFYFLRFRFVVMILPKYHTLHGIAILNAEWDTMQTAELSLYPILQGILVWTVSNIFIWCTLCLWLYIGRMLFVRERCFKENLLLLNPLPIGELWMDLDTLIPQSNGWMSFFFIITYGSSYWPEQFRSIISYWPEQFWSMISYWPELNWSINPFVGWGWHYESLGYDTDSQWVKQSSWVFYEQQNPSTSRQNSGTFGAIL